MCTIMLYIINTHCQFFSQVTETYYDSFIDYLELSRIDAPAEVGLPIMNGNNIRSDAVLNFLVLKLSRISLELSK